MSRVHLYTRTDSTMLRLQEYAQRGEGVTGLTIFAEEQTAGLGRQGRRFISPGGLGVYLSMLVLPDGPHTSALLSPLAWTTLTSRIGVAACRAVESVCGERPGIKWVNDLWMGKKKIGGILVQTDLSEDGSTVRQIRIGIGINVLEKENDFPEELQEIASSLLLETGRDWSREELAAALICELDALLARWPEGQAKDLEACRRDSVILGKEIFVLTGSEHRAACAEAILDDFALQVRYPDGQREVLRGGEVTIRT